MNLANFDTNVRTFDDVRRALDSIKQKLKLATNYFGTLDRKVDSGETRIIRDEHCAVAADYFEVNGTLELQGDAALEII